MKAFIYARYSDDSQREESIEGQLRECKEYAERNGITVLGSYIDRALSAKTDNRPEFQRMIKDSDNKLFDVIIVWKLDRFARNRYDSAHYKAILRKNGVKVISATEAIAEDSTGILLESLLEGYAEFYSAELSEKVSRGMKENALKCKFNGGAIPIGYVIDSEHNYQIDPITAPIVQEVFTLYDNGTSMLDLVSLMNDRGLRTARGHNIDLNSIARMLKKRNYIGEYRYNDIVHPDGIPAIIPQDLFDRVQTRMEKNKKAPARKRAEDEYLLTTKLFCGTDGVFMVGESGVSHTAKVHRYYRCVNSKKKKLCNRKPVKKIPIENYVVHEVVEFLKDNNAVDYIVDRIIKLQSKEKTNIPYIENQLEETEKSINNMLNAIQQGILTSSTKQRLDELEARKVELEICLLQEQIQKPLLTKEQLKFWICKFRDSDITNPKHRQRLVDTFVNSVYIFDDHITITLNYKDGTKTVTLKEIDELGLGSSLSSNGSPERCNLNGCSVCSYKTTQ